MREAPTGALRAPPPQTREQEREEVKQAGPNSSQPHPAPGVLQLILDLSNRCFTNTDFLSAKNFTCWADSGFFVQQ